MKKKMVLFVLTGILFLAVSGCGGPDAGGNASTEGSAPGTASEAASGASFKAGYISASATLFFDTVYLGLEDSVQANGGTITRLNSQLDLQDEIANVETFISQGIDVLFISCVDANSSANAVKRANDADIPVIALVSKPEGDCEFLTYIKSDDVKAAHDIALWAFEQIGNAGDVLIIDGAPVSDVLDRMKGYQQAIAETDEINLVGTGMVKPEEFSIATCTRITEDLLQAHPSAKVILGFCGYVIPGAVTAMETFNRQDVIVVDVDGMPEETSLIESGEAAQCATMGQYPYDFGVKGVEIFLQYRADPSAEFPEFTAVDTMLVTKDNVTEFDGFSRLAQ